MRERIKMKDMVAADGSALAERLGVTPATLRALRTRGQLLERINSRGIPIFDDLRARLTDPGAVQSDAPSHRDVEGNVTRAPEHRSTKAPEHRSTPSRHGPPPPPPELARPFTVRLSPAMHERLRSYAFTYRSSTSAVVEKALAEFLNEWP